MSKNKNRKKGPIQQPVSAYNHFLHEMQLIMKEFVPKRDFNSIPNQYRKMMYDFSYRINNPTAANEYISPKELKIIGDKIKRYYRAKTVSYRLGTISTFQIHLLYCYCGVRAIEVEKSKNDEPEGPWVFKDLRQKLLDQFHTRFIIDVFRVITQLSDPCHKYYGINVRAASIFKDDPKMELLFEVYGIPVRKYLMDINGNRRPVFQLGKASCAEPVEWIIASASKLFNFYKGTKKELEVYIQSHALNRLKERLDLLDAEALNYTLWENTNSVLEFEKYRNYLLLPFKVFDIKIGYLVANVIDEKVVFRTFLFITHNSTPEGDRLKKLTGLGKDDISYWHIDRLSTFMKINEEKHEALIRLFREAGMGDLMELKNKEFNIDTMQEANLDGLTEYIKKGKMEIIYAT